MRIVIPDDWNAAYESATQLDALRSRAEVVIVGQRSPAMFQALRDADIVVGLRERTKFDANQLAQMPKLKLICQLGGKEVPHIDLPTATERGVLVCSTSGMGASPASMVELTIGVIIAALRQFPQQDRVLHEGGWPRPTGRIMQGKLLGIVGLGRLGSAVANAAQFFGMRVAAAGKTLTPERAAAAGVEFFELHRLFAEADVISIHLKLNAATRGLVTRQLIERMKPDAFLINTARGPVLDEAALVDALKEGRIAGAALDVYDEEPLPADHPLRGCDRALLLGHCGWPTDANYADLVPRTVEVITAFLDGQPINMINPDALHKQPA